MNSEQASNSASSLYEWQPEVQLPEILKDEVRLANGFLQCKPERWFPGFSAHWLPLLHSLDLSPSFVATQPRLFISTEEAEVYCGSIDGEYISLVINKENFDKISSILIPSCNNSTAHIIVEYFARRLLTSLASSWSGAKSESVFRYESEFNGRDIKFSGGIDLKLKLNDQDVFFTIGLSSGSVELLHSLWLSQQTTNALEDLVTEDSIEVKINLLLGAAFVRPTEITTLFEPGQLIYLSPSAGKKITISLDEEPYMNGVLLRSADGSVFRSQGGQVGFGLEESPEGKTRIDVSIGEVLVEKNQLSKLKTAGTLMPLKFTPSSEAILLLAGKPVAKATVVTNGTAYAVQVMSRI